MAAKKKIICPKCKAKLKFDPDKIISGVVKFKCPGCSSILRVKKPIPKKEPSLSSPASQSGLKTEANIEQLGIKSLDRNSNTEIKNDVSEVDQAGKGQEIESAKPEKIIDISTARKPLSGEEHGPLIPGDKPVTEKPSGGPLLEDYDHENLKEYEKGEAEAGNLEWTRYADKTESLIPESKIDLNVIPAAESELQETLADLQQSEMYNLQGENHLGKNRIKQAIRDFNHSLEINPDYVDALVNRGSAYALENRFNDALQDFNHALEVDREQAEIYNLRGEIYLLNKMYDLATKDFTAAIILNPMYSDAFLNRARTYSEKGMKEEAELDYNQAIKAAPGKFSDFADLDGSESLFDEDNFSSKEKAARYIQQGLEDLKAEKYYDAIESFTQAINLSSDDARGYRNRGQAYVELNQPDEAMVDLNRAVIYDPLNPTLYYWRAMAWKALDSRINMVADLKLSCELGYEPACNEYQRLKPKKH